MTGHYNRSFDLLTELSSASTEEKFKDFEIALMYRLGRFDKCGLPGKILLAILNHSEAEPDTINEAVDFLKERSCYSEFTTYHIHLLLATSYFYSCLYDDCLDHLFGCLEEIQNNFIHHEEYCLLSDSMLSEIKFNIVVTNMCKDAMKTKEISDETSKYIELFLGETEDDHFASCMNRIIKIIKAG